MLLFLFPLSFIETQKWVPLYCTAIFVLIGTILDHLTDVSRENIVKLGLQLLPLNFMSDSRLELMFVFLIVNIGSSFNYLYGFQLLVLLPQLIKITSFTSINKIDMFDLKRSSDMLVIITKGFLNLLNLLMLIIKDSISSQKTLLIRFLVDS